MLEESHTKIEKIHGLVVAMKEVVGRKSRDNSEAFRERELRTVLELRKLHRSLYLDLEQERKSSQLENEKLDKETIFLECLDYQKNQLVSNIGMFKQLKTTNLNNIRNQQLASLKSADELKDKGRILAELEKELQDRKRKKVKLEHHQREKEQLSDYYQLQDRQYFQDLPSYLKKIQNELSPILDVFQLPQIALPQQQAMVQELPPPLQICHEKLARYEDENKNEQYPIKLEIAVGLAKPETSLYHLCPHELKLSLLPPQELEYIHILKPSKHETLNQICDYFGVSTEEFTRGVYPLTLVIQYSYVLEDRYFSTLNRVVLSVDRKCKLSTEELLCGLIRGDQGELMFTNPKNDEESNINNRFMYYFWLQEFAKQPASLLTTSKIVQLLHAKVLNHLQLRFQIEKLKNSELPRPMLNNHADNGLQGLKLKYFGKIPTAQVSEPVPFWFKHFDSVSLKAIEITNQDLAFQVDDMHFEKKSLLLNDDVLKVYFQERYCTENQLEHLNEVYKLIVEKEDTSFELAVIIPQRYPQQPARFQLLKQDQVSNKRWFQIQKSLLVEQQLLPGFEGLLLSIQLYRVLQKLSSETESKPTLQLCPK